MLSLLFLSPFLQAKECKLNQNYVKADYQVTHQVPNKAQQSQGFTLWRAEKQVAQQDEHFIEVWQQLKNGQIRPIRYFEQQRRGIEYQPSEVQGKQDWSAKYQLVSDNLLAKMTLKKSSGSGCDLIEYYQLNDGDNQIELSWLKNQKLVKAMRLTMKTSRREVVLSEAQFDSEKVQQQFSSWDRYQTTDYADIGDNENDPFLVKMINLGFIEHGDAGFYNANGQQIQGSHGHNH